MAASPPSYSPTFGGLLLAGEVVTQSAAFGDTTEDAVVVDPPPGEYVAHVVNYDQVVDPPDDWFNGAVTF